MANKQQQKRMEKIVARFQEYVATYSDQPQYRNYSESIFLDDMLYGIGVALDPSYHQGASGYDKFKARLTAHMNKRARD